MFNLHFRPSNYTHFIDEEAEAQRVKSTFLIITWLNKWQAWGSNPVWLDKTAQTEAPGSRPLGKFLRLPTCFLPHLPNGAAGGQVSSEGLLGLWTCEGGMELGAAACIGSSGPDGEWSWET